jgi:hypothetical protein
MSQESQYPVKLNLQTQIPAEKFFLQLSNTDALIFPQTLFENKQLISQYAINNSQIRSEDPKSGFVETNPDSSPAIISAIHASFCTLLLAFNENGQAMILHQPLVYAGHFDDWFQIIKEKIRLMQTLTKKDGTLIVSATNHGLPHQQKIIKEISRIFPPQKIIPFFTKHQKTNFPFGPEVAKDNISGICFFPKNLSLDGRNKIIFLTHQNI